MNTKPSSVSLKSQYETLRPILNEKILKNKYTFEKQQSNNALKATARYCGKYYRPSRLCMIEYFFDRIPFLRWILEYNVRECLLKDIIAGLTIGIVHIPQGMAYSMMAGLPAVYGLYVSFFPVLIYALLGTSRHLSIGSFAITSLMTYSSIQKMEGKYWSKEDDRNLFANNSSTSKLLSNDANEAKVLISMSLTFLVGIIQILFAILHIGVVTKFLSDVIVMGFTTGAGFHIVLSQVYPLLGLPSEKLQTPFKLIENIVIIIKNIGSSNPPTIICGAIAIILFVAVKEGINERFKDKMIMPIPMELIIVVFGTLLAYLFDFQGVFKIKTVGKLELGFPAPMVPPMSIIPDIFGDALSIAIVSFAVNISMAKLFSKKYKYELSPNQEAFAYGLGNILSSFFSGFPACVALSRSAILDSVGGKTQIFGLVSSGLILIVIIAVGPLFRTLPNACLAAIIVVALKNMLLQILQFPVIIRRSKFEALAWTATFLGVIILDVDVGLYIGVAFTLMLIIFRSQRPRISVLGVIPETDIYESIEICREAEEIPQIKILRFEESIYYANVDNFKYKVIKCSNINVNDVIGRINKEKLKFKKIIEEQNDIKEEACKNLEQVEATLESRISEIKNNLPIKHIILDCSCINNIDSQGVNAFLTLYEIFSELDIALHLTFCKPCVLKMFKKVKFEDKFNYEFIYPTTHDAVCSINFSRQVTIESNLSGVVFIDENETKI